LLKTGHIQILVFFLAYYATTNLFEYVMWWMVFLLKLALGITGDTTCVKGGQSIVCFVTKYILI
jgi:hypothetical protein